MFGTHHVDVLVVGAGPVGLLSALLLAQNNIKLEIVDEEWRTGAHSYALALHPATLSLLKKVDLLDEVLPRGHKVPRLAFYDGAVRCGEVDLSRLNAEFPFILVLRQDVLESLLEHKLLEKRIHVHWNQSVSHLESGNDHALATIDELGRSSGGYAVATTDWMIERQRHLEAKFVLGADGHRSIVRKSIAAHYREIHLPQAYAVFEFHCKDATGDEMRVVLDDTTSNVVWPMPGEAARWSFQLLEVSASAPPRFKSRLAVQIGSWGYPYLNRGDLDALIAQRAPWFKAAIGEMYWSMTVQFEQRLTDCFGKDRLWLAGDAGHLAGPIGVQSMNIGLREASDLVDRLEKILHQHAGLELLEQYNQERLAEWRSLLGPAVKVTAMETADPWVRQRADRILPCLPASGPELHQAARQLGLEIG